MNDIVALFLFVMVILFIKKGRGENPQPFTLKPSTF